MGSSHSQQAYRGTCALKSPVQGCGRRLDKSHFPPRQRSLFQYCAKRREISSSREEMIKKVANKREDPYYLDVPSRSSLVPGVIVLLTSSWERQALVKSKKSLFCDNFVCKGQLNKAEVQQNNNARLVERLRGYIYIFFFLTCTNISSGTA